MERRYAQTQKEALALGWACERFYINVGGREFELETDHKPLKCIFHKTSKQCARIERWVLRLQYSEREDIVRFVTTEATPVALTTREIEHD